MSRIAVVVPSIRPDQWNEFMEAWMPLFERHDVTILTVWDGEEPRVDVSSPLPMKTRNWKAIHILGSDADLIFNRTDACRNLGFAYIAKNLPDVEVIITLDDDTRPDPNHPDPIQAHLDILGKRVPVSWLSSVAWGVPFMRGFPYNAREEAEVIISHGVWTGVPDFDAQTQLSRPEMVGDFQGPFYTGPVPRGVHMPFCGMNVGFKREALPLMYYAPMGPRAGYHRWADILLGMELCQELSLWGEGAIFTGASVVRHDRASDPIKNLPMEWASIALGDAYWKDPLANPEYNRLYSECRRRWKLWMAQHVGAFPKTTGTRRGCSYCGMPTPCADSHCPGYDEARYGRTAIHV